MIIVRRLAVALAVLAIAVPVGRAAHAPPALVDACGGASGIDARALWLTASDGIRLYAVSRRDAGPRRSPLAHQGRSDLCQELPYAKTLLAGRLRVFAFDFRGNGRSERPDKNQLALGRDLAAAVARVHKDGAKRVFLIGASMGAPLSSRTAPVCRSTVWSASRGRDYGPATASTNQARVRSGLRFSTSAAEATRSHR